MSFAAKLVMIVLVTYVVGAQAHAANPREELNQMMQQLQKTPNDNALRENIIKFARTVRPSPMLTEEAERRMVRGAAAFKSAKSPSDFGDAVREFELASLSAPWSGDVYYNLGLAQDKAGDHVSAARSLKLALLASPTSKETKNLLYEVEYRAEKTQAKQARQLDFEGDWVCPYIPQTKAIYIFRKEPGSQWVGSIEHWDSDGKIWKFPFDRVWLEGDRLLSESRGAIFTQRREYRIDPDGTRLTRRSILLQDASQNAEMKRVGMGIRPTNIWSVDNDPSGSEPCVRK